MKRLCKVVFFFVIFVLFTRTLTACSSDQQSTQVNDSSVNDSATTIMESPQPEESEVPPVEDTVEEVIEQVDNEVVEEEKPIEPLETEEIIDDIVEEENLEETLEDEEIPYHLVDDFEISYQTDYAHISGGDVTLGNDEKLSIVLTAKPDGLVEDDFIFYCEDEQLVYTIDSIEDNETSHQTIFRLTVRSLSEGYHDFAIFSTYDILSLGEESPGIELHVDSLNSRDGRIVYVTDTGEKYHYSYACAGENATATTLFDAEAYEYEPCSKCAQ